MLQTHCSPDRSSPIRGFSCTRITDSGRWPCDGMPRLLPKPPLKCGVPSPAPLGSTDSDPPQPLGTFPTPPPSPRQDSYSSRFFIRQIHDCMWPCGRGHSQIPVPKIPSSCASLWLVSDIRCMSGPGPMLGAGNTGSAWLGESQCGNGMSRAGTRPVAAEVYCNGGRSRGWRRHDLWLRGCHPLLPPLHQQQGPVHIPSLDH